MKERAVALRFRSIHAELVVEIAKANRLKIEESADGDRAFDPRLGHHHCRQMAAGGVACNMDAVGGGIEVTEVANDPCYGQPDFCDDAVHTDRRCQTVL